MKRHLIVIAEEKGSIQRLLKKAVETKPMKREWIQGVVPVSDEAGLFDALFDNQDIPLIVLLSASFSSRTHESLILKIREKAESVHIVTLTQKYGDRSSMEYGAFDSIDKPIRNPVLWEIIDRAMLTEPTVNRPSVPSQPPVVLEEKPVVLPTPLPNVITEETEEDSLVSTGVMSTDSLFSEDEDDETDDLLVEREEPLEEKLEIIEPSDSEPLLNETTVWTETFEPLSPATESQELVENRQPAPVAEEEEGEEGDGDLEFDFEEEAAEETHPTEGVREVPGTTTPDPLPDPSEELVNEEAAPLSEPESPESPSDATEEGVEADEVGFTFEDEDEEEDDEDLSFEWNPPPVEPSVSTAHPEPVVVDTPILNADTKPTVLTGTETETPVEPDEPELWVDLASDADVSITPEQTEEPPAEEEEEKPVEVVSHPTPEPFVPPVVTPSEVPDELDVPEETLHVDVEEAELTASTTLEPNEEIIEDVPVYNGFTEWTLASEGFTAKNGQFVPLSPPRASMMLAAGGKPSRISTGKSPKAAGAESDGLLGSVRNMFKKK